MNSELQAIEERERQDRQARDMFAAAALQGSMVGSPSLAKLDANELILVFDRIAEVCWAAADAMMRKRGES